MDDANRLRVLIADDEPLARQRIEDLLGRESGVEIVGRAPDGATAARAIRELAPDLVFLDVQMPAMTGLEVVDAIGVEEMPVTIFVTAFDQFAVKAFELAAVDYLVKPFDDDRFARAFRRARQRVELEETEEMTRRLLALLQRDDPPKARAEPRDILDRITVESRGQVRVVMTSDIDFITASGPYAELHVGKKTFIVRERMHSLEERLDPAIFLRVHRSAIVRIDRIDALLRRPGGDYAVRLKDGTEVPVSRGRRDELQERLGVE